MRKEDYYHSFYILNLVHMEMVRKDLLVLRQQLKFKNEVEKKDVYPRHEDSTVNEEITTNLKDLNSLYTYQ